MRKPKTGVVEIISRDPAKVETYCAIGKLGVQIEDANEAKDKKTADGLTQKMRGLEKQLGPEYLSLMYGLQEIDPESEDGVEIEATNGPRPLLVTNVRYWHKADMPSCAAHVRFWG